MVVGLALNSNSLISSETTDSIIKSFEDHSTSFPGKIMIDKELLERIDNYTNNNYKLLDDNPMRLNVSTDTVLFTLVQRFANDQIDLDDDFMDALNHVTRKIGKNEPTKARL
jgi:hypothetical protein